MNDFKDFYIVVVVAVFIVGIMVGALSLSLISEECKTRKELCHLDIKQNSSLQKALNVQESICTKKIDTLVKKALLKNDEKFNLKFTRLQDACNQLDCAQCER